MSFKRFFYLLASIGLISTLIVLGLSRFLRLDTLIKQMSLGSIIIFSFFCLVFFSWGKMLSESRNPYNFNNVIIMSTLSKMIISMAFLLSFKRIFNPDSKYVYVPFLIFYIVYAIFETYFLTILGKQKIKQHD